MLGSRKHFPEVTEAIEMNCKILFIVLINVLYVCSSPYFTHLMSKRARYCGSALTNMLSFVCKGHYATLEKKSYEDRSYYGEYEDDYDGSDNEVDLPFVSKEFAKSLIPQKMRRQVNDECCKKPCTLEHMARYYCAP